MTIWGVVIWSLVMLACFGSGWRCGELWMTWKLYRAEKAGRIAVVKLPSKAEIEAVLKKHGVKADEVESTTSSNKTGFLH